MDIKEKLIQLINDGEQVKNKNSKLNTPVGDVISGEEYENWIARCIIFLESNAKTFSPTLTKKFIDAGNGDSNIKNYNTMIGILKAFKESEGNNENDDSDPLVYY